MHAVKPLPFNAARLRGLSEKLMRLRPAAARPRQSEHAYAIDYGAAAAKYVDAFFQNIHWDEVNRRLESAKRRST